MTTDRNATSSSAMDGATTTPISHGSRLPIRFANVTLPAFGPVRYAPFGRTVSFSRLTRALVAASCSPAARGLRSAGATATGTTRPGAEGILTARYGWPEVYGHP